MPLFKLGNPVDTADIHGVPVWLSMTYVTVCLAYLREARNLHVKINSKACVWMRQNKKREWRQKVD